jgi:hypothetical protein
MSGEARDRRPYVTTAQAINVAQRERAARASIEAIADLLRVSRRQVYRWVGAQLTVVEVLGFRATYALIDTGDNGREPRRISKWRKAR